MKNTRLTTAMPQPSLGRLAWYWGGRDDRLTILRRGFKLPRRRSLAPLLLLIGTALAASNVAATTYRIVLLPPPPGMDERALQPLAINNAAEVVGQANVAHAIAWSTGPAKFPSACGRKR